MNETPILLASQQIVSARNQTTPVPVCGGRGQLTGSATILYTAPVFTSPTGATRKALLTSILLCNTDGSARTVTLYLVESGGSVAANRAILSAESLAASGAAGHRVTLQFDPPIPLESGETVRGLASVATVVTYRISVIET